MTAELDDLARLAQAATPGPWWREGYGVLGPREEWDLNSGTAMQLAVMQMPHKRPRMEANAEFIAAANPATILHLIETLRLRDLRLSLVEADRDRLAARLAAVEALYRGQSESGGNRHAYCIDAADLRAALSAAPTDTTKETS